MAETPKKDDARSLPDRLVSDPKNPPELTLLQGWLGTSSEDRHRRLYLDPELSQSLEIPEDAIVSTQEMPRESSPLGGSWVWVKADASIKQGPGLERLYARFLRGQIQQDFFAAAGGGGVGAAAAAAPGPAPTSPVICQFQPTIIGCPTRQVWCQPSVFTICPTRPILCQSRLTLCASQFINCPTQTSFCQVTAGFTCNTRICPSAVDACPSAPGGCFDPGNNPVINPAAEMADPFAAQGGFQAGFQGGFGFDPGAAFGLAGAPGPTPTSPVICQFQPTIIGCPTRQVWCQPSVFTRCPTQTVLCQTRITCPSQFVICPTQTFFCQPTQPIQCQSRFCPSIIDGCPSTPGGCFDPGFNPVVNPAVNAVAPAAAFDPAAGVGLTGASSQFACPFVPTLVCPTALPICAHVTQFVHCPPSRYPLLCPTRSITCQITRFPGCPPPQTLAGPFCQTTAGFTCNTRICPSAVDACPSAPGGCFEPGGPVFDLGAFGGGMVGGRIVASRVWQCVPTLIGCVTHAGPGCPGWPPPM